jgi:hypothetical protein
LPPQIPVHSEELPDVAVEELVVIFDKSLEVYERLIQIIKVFKRPSKSSAKIRYVSAAPRATINMAQN